MGNQRIFLWAILALILWLCYEAWMQDYHAPAPVPPASQQTGASGEPPAPARLDDSVPGLPATSTQPGEAAASPAEVTPDATISGRKVRVVTDVLDLDIDLAGGTLSRAELPEYPLHKNQPDIPVKLLDDASQYRFLFQSGLTTGDAGEQPNHLATFVAPSGEYRMRENQDELRVPLTWRNEQGMEVTKTFTFRRGSYAIDLDYQVSNASGTPWTGASYLQLLRRQPPVDRSLWDVESYAFRGPALYDGQRYMKLDIDDEDDRGYSQSVSDGWLAAMQHHFVAAAVPAAGHPYQFQLRVENGTYLLSAVGPTRTVQPGERAQFGEKMFVGPKLQDQLEATGPKLDLTADYGKLTIISKPLFIVLDWVHNLVGNWGWAIVLVTLLIKLAFYPLSETSGRSMAKMRLLAPRIKNIQERYKDNREQLGRAMMEIYKREKINPLAGCLPMLVQIPVFLAFYWVLLESVEMRQAPFMLWINDLSSRDPFFILPLLMGGAMFVQFKLNPAPPDPMQAKIFMIMPIVMTVMFAFFPSGLVLYWLTNTLLSIAQQWNINRRIEAGKKV
jgi:YidC/Oxa1 family membrane protein insertase